MQKNRKKKIGVTAVSVSVLTLGAAGLAYAYQSGIDFKPGKDTRDIQENQIVFDEDKNSTSQTDKDKEESKLWEKENQSNDKTNSEVEKTSQFLFEQALAKQEGNTSTIGIIGENGSVSGGNGTNSNNPVYDIVSDPSRADTILSGVSGGNRGPSDSGTRPGLETGTNNDGNNTGNDKNQNGNPSQDNSNTNQGGNTGSIVRDPEAEKGLPGLGESKPYVEGIIPALDSDENGENQSVVIQKSTDYEGIYLYKGQPVDANTIYCALDTLVVGKDGNFYAWGADALEQYIRIEGISFDGGSTWNSEFPVTIPKDISEGQMKIKVGFRFSKNDTRWTSRIVDYDPEDNRVFLLSKQLTKEDTVIDKNNILNSNQYLAEGGIMNLFRYQQDLLGDGELTSLFPGWKENGEFVPWFYTAQSGRHILEPADMVPISDEYIAELRLLWMSDDYEVGNQYNNLCYLQTLVNVGKDAIQEETRGHHWFMNQRYDVLEIPKYIQAVMIEDGSDIKVDYLKIPDTVLYIEDTENSIQVDKGYEVESDNPRYASLKDGILTNKEKTEFLNIPYELESLTISDKVTKVNISAKNKISKLEIQASSMNELPELNYDNLADCEVFVQDQILEEYLEQNADVFTKESNRCVVAQENKEITYQVENNAIVSNQGKIRRALKTGGSTLTLSSNMKSVEDGALESVSRVETIVMPKNGQNVIFEEGCFRGSELKTIRCYTEKQYQSVEKQLNQTGASQDIKVQLVSVSKEGFTYSSESEGGITNTVILDAPKNLQEFEGIITSKDGEKITVTEIGEQAFADCDNLEWVTLPESVTKIGYQAFKNCTALNGVLIDTRDTITIGNQSFDGCSHLRFVASNAEHGIMEDGYEPTIQNESDTHGTKQNYFYIPSVSDGYMDKVVKFTVESGVKAFDVVEIGGNAKMLYGIDDAGTPWLALRAGGETSGEVSLPESTIEIFSYAMTDIHSETGAFTLNWDEIDWMWAFDESAFQGSDLSGDITLADDSMLFENAFADCTNINSIKVPGTDIYIGPNVFQNCENLTSVEFGDSTYHKTLPVNLFEGCNNLSDITFDGETPFKLTIPYMGSEYRFNYNWTPKEEVENLHIHVPKGTEEEYVKAWRYYFAGYYSTEDTPAYLQMWDTIQMEHLDWNTWEYPADEEVDEYVETELLEAENKVRGLLDIPDVSEPTDFYPYRLSYTGELTLVGAPSNLKELNLETADLEMPEGWYLDYIGSHSFSKAANLQQVIIPDTLAGIYTDAFDGVASEHLTLIFEGTTPLSFLGWDTQSPFSFGMDESKVTIEVPEGSEEDYIRALEFPLLGYTDIYEMQEAIRTELEEKGQTVTEDKMKEEIVNRLIAVENRIRTMMGMSKISSAEELACEWNLNLHSSEEAESEESRKEENLQESTVQNAEISGGAATSDGEIATGAGGSEISSTEEINGESKDNKNSPVEAIDGESKVKEEISGERSIGKAEEITE